MDEAELSGGTSTEDEAREIAAEEAGTADNADVRSSNGLRHSIVMFNTRKIFLSVSH
jgi:hypothetical protein